MLCYVMLCYVMLCYVMLCYVMLCYVMIRNVMLNYVTLCYVTLCYVAKHLVVSCGGKTLYSANPKIMIVSVCRGNWDFLETPIFLFHI